MRHRHTSHLALVAAVTFSLSACTFTTTADNPKAVKPPSATREATTAPTAAAVYQLMRKSGAAAESVHVKGAYSDNGQKLHLDVAGDRAGREMRLLVDFGNGAIEILKVNDDFYLRADAAYWTRLDGSAAITNVGYPFHCPRRAAPLLLGVSGRQHHKGWGSGTAFGRLGQ